MSNAACWNGPRGRIALLAVLCLFVRPGIAQTLFGLSDQPFQLSDTVELDEPDDEVPEVVR